MSSSSLSVNSGRLRSLLSISNLLLLFLAGLFLCGLFSENPLEGLSHLWLLQLQPGRLISDFTLTAGTGAALMNAALVGLAGYLAIVFTRIPFSGPTFAAVMTMTGFGLFGKTPLNILPVILGVWLSARLVNKHLKDYLIIALFGTALGPLVSALAWEVGLSPFLSLPLAVAGGLVTGFLLPPIAVAMLHLHQGYNLYNMGLSCGFFALFATAIIKGLGVPMAGRMEWNENPSPWLRWLIPILSLFFLLASLLGKRHSLWKNFKQILKSPGRLPSDFVDIASREAALFNCAIIGIAGFLYIWIIDAPFNGPVIGGLLTIMGFAAFGTHPANSWPVVSGVIGAALLGGHSLKEPGPVLAAIFCTTLGPLAGQFGIVVGILSGALHFFMVMQTGAWTGAMNLYNNGFAGGLTASLIVSFIQWYRTNRLEH